jgi:hypothetical protein
MVWISMYSGSFFSNKRAHSFLQQASLNPTKKRKIIRIKGDGRLHATAEIINPFYWFNMTDVWKERKNSIPEVQFDSSKSLSKGMQN